METKLKVKPNYQTFDQADSIEKAQKLIDKLKCRKIALNSFRLNAHTIVQIADHRNNANQIIERVKGKCCTINLIDQIEYGQYA